MERALYTLFWINEPYDENDSDTYYKLVNNEKIKIVTVVGTRPEIIRLSSTINKLNSLNSFKHTLIHTGQNYDYELNEVFFNDLNINKPDFYLNISKKSSIDAVGDILIKIQPIFKK